MIDLNKKIFQICNDAYQNGRQVLVEGTTRKILYERFTTSDVTELNGVTVRVSKWSNWSKATGNYLHKAYHCRPISIDEIFCDKTTEGSKQEGKV